MNLDIDQLQEQLHDIDRQRHEVGTSGVKWRKPLTLRIVRAIEGCTGETVLLRALHSKLRARPWAC